MNVSSSQRALWAIALLPILGLGFGNPASAREYPRERAVEDLDGETDVRRVKRDGDARARGGPRIEPRAERDAQDAPRVDVRPPAAQAEVQRRAGGERGSRQWNDAGQPPAPLARGRTDQDHAAREAAMRARTDAQARLPAPRSQRDDVAQRAARRAEGMPQAIPPAARRVAADPRQGASRRPDGQWQSRRNDAIRGDDARRGPPRTASGPQDQRIRAEHHRAEQYRHSQAQRRQRAEHRGRQLQQQRRIAQYRHEQEYLQRLRQQQAGWNARRYDSYDDRYFHTPASYRYAYGGGYRETNRYGADLMRQAVNYGYQEGLRAGRADRLDGWRGDYRSSYGYQDASYGYDGFYLDQDVYHHYFRQGFQRGYQDSYSSSYRYGRRDGSGNYGLLAPVLGMILGLQLLH